MPIDSSHASFIGSNTQDTRAHSMLPEDRSNPLDLPVQTNMICAVFCLLPLVYDRIQIFWDGNNKMAK